MKKGKILRLGWVIIDNWEFGRKMGKVNRWW